MATELFAGKGFGIKLNARYLWADGMKTLGLSSAWLWIWGGGRGARAGVMVQKNSNCRSDSLFSNDKTFPFSSRSLPEIVINHAAISNTLQHIRSCKLTNSVTMLMDAIAVYIWFAVATLRGTCCCCCRSNKKCSENRAKQHV